VAALNLPLSHSLHASLFSKLKYPAEQPEQVVDALKALK
jgi:hypothetical protein